MRRLSAYLPVVLWMGMIFLASTDIGSTRHTSRILRPLLQWLNPNVTEETVKLVQAIVRKSGHVSEYAVLGALVWRARVMMGRVRPWNMRQFCIVLVICASYAGSDEFHQLFVASRQASFIDVLIDTCGSTLGLLLVWKLSSGRPLRVDEALAGPEMKGNCSF